MIRVGIVGIGFMGMIHYLAYQKVTGAKVTAICSRDAKKRSGDWRGIQGNFGPPGEEMDLTGVAQYAELEELLADPEIDLVDICLPPHLHADAAIQCMQAGKHVLVEKPMTLGMEQAELMVKTAETTQRQLLVAHVLPFFPEFAHAHQLVMSGQYGPLKGASFKRIISDPTWIPDFYDPQRVGGPVIDLHIHDAHFIRLLCGMPEAVYARGRMRGEVVEYMNVDFLFPNRSLVVHAQTGVILQQGRKFTHAFEIHLEQATLVYDFAVLGSEVVGYPLTILTNDGEAVRPALGQTDPVDAFVGELSAMVESLTTGIPSPLLSGVLARDALLICQRETQSVREGGIVSV